MFERFTDKARRVVVLAQEEARMVQHNYIGTEHLLLGVIRENQGVAAGALRALNIDLEELRQEVLVRIGHGQASPHGHIPFTPPAKKSLELSLRESLQLGHSYIGTEHILLGVIRENEGIAAHVLIARGADLNTVREVVERLLGEYRTAESGEGTYTNQPARRPAGELSRLEEISLTLRVLRAAGGHRAAARHREAAGSRGRRGGAWGKHHR
jgi:ATP-dependent Clp protease ATP-binding subunit ClpC